MLAHELRNPLGAISSAVGVMEMVGGDPGDRAREIIKRQLQNLSQLVEDLVDTTRITTGKISLARSTRPDDEIAPAFTKEFVNWGAGTRAVQYLVLGAKARAAIAGEYNVTVDHVRDVAPEDMHP